MNYFEITNQYTKSLICPILGLPSYAGLMVSFTPVATGEALPHSMMGIWFMMLFIGIDITKPGCNFSVAIL